MTLKYRYFFGGGFNPYRKERDEAYAKLTEEANLKDPSGSQQLEVLFPMLDTWPDYVIAESKNTFWEMERDVFEGGEDAAERVETLWRESLSNGVVGDWLKKAEADEAEKAMSLYIAIMHRQFDPDDATVDFRLYFSESGTGKSLEEDESFNINPYEG